MFSEWAATLPENSVCVLTAVIIQYSLLSCFSWMAIEALHLYCLLIKVFNTHIKRYMIKLSLFGWGMPAVLVGGSLCGFGIKPLYGKVNTTLSNTNGTSESNFCWITDTHFLYGMNITYFSLTFLFNTFVLAIVTHQIFKLQCLNIGGSKLPSRKNICTVLGLTILLGMAWGFAFFTSGYTNYPVLYLFCIFNSFQGFFLFFWVCCTVKKNRGTKGQFKILSEPTSNSLNLYSSFSH
ncbi:adhesion G-protein coupled receptor G2-like [Clarias gariepinus]